MDSSKIKALIIVVLALCFALYLGVAAATAQLEALAWVGGGVFFAVCLLLGKHIWILIPASLGLRGGFNFLPGAIEPWHLATATVGIFYILRILTRQQRLNLRWCALDTAVLAVAFTILQAFLRNPTGLLLMGGEDAGGKPYLVFSVAIIAYFLVGMAEANIKSYRWAVLAYIMFSIADGCLVALSGLSQEFAMLILPYYSNVSLSATTSLELKTNLDETRFSDFAQLGTTLGLVACTFWRPVGALDITKPWRAIIALVGVAATVLSGYRSYAGRLFINFILGSILRGRTADTIIVAILSFITISVVVTAVPSTSLPYSVQRLLTVIPGYQSGESASTDAIDSIESRVEMWKLALFTDRYISNKVLGDGFQLAKKDAELITAWSLGDKHIRSTMTFQDIMMASGSYHGFHAETIRLTGIVGLAAATWLLIILAIYSLKSIRFFRENPAWGCVLFICMPLLIEPLWVWLVYGSYKGVFYRTIATAALVKLLYLLSNRFEKKPTG
jgi:hypothetical protein